ANTHGTQVAVINGDDNSVLNLVTVGNDPTSIAVNPSNNKVYVGNLNYFRDTVNNRVFYGLSIFDGSDDSVTTSSTYNLTRIGTPYDVAVNSSTGNVYVAQDGVLSVISSSGLTMVPLFSEPRGVAVNPNTNKIYITNDQSSSAVGVHVVDGTTGQVIKNIAFYPNPDFNLSNAPYGIAVNTQLNQIYVTLPSAGQLVRIDGATDTIIDSVTVDMLVSRTVDSDGTIHETYSTDHPSGIAFNPVTNTIYVTNNGSSYPSLSVIHVNGDGTLNVDRTLHPAGVAPLGVAVDTSTDKVYVGCTVNSKVALKVIKGSTYDNAAYTEEATLPFSYGNGYQVPDPAGVAVNSATHQVYLADGQQLQVIDGTNNTVTTAIPFSNNSSFQYYGAGVAVNEADNRVYVSASSSLSGALIAISGATNQVLSQIGGADSSSSYGGAFNLAFNPQTKRIYTVGYSGYYAGSSGGLMQTAFDGIDSTPPTVTVNQPYADNGYGGGFYHSTGTVDSGALLQATGTSQDVRSDVTSVKVKLHRDARDTTPAGWWAGGSTWTSTYSDAANLLSATLSDNGNYNNNRNWTFTLPTVIQGFTDATYTLTAVSSDEVGNVGTSDAVNFQIDNTAPTITITQPQDGHSYLNSDAAVRTIKGTAADDLNGSGIASDYDYSSGQGVSKPQLHIRLTRGADAQHQNQLWSGSANQDGSPYYYDLSQTPAYDSINYYPAFFGTANQDGSVNWSKALPPLDAGVYTLRVLTKDKAGNDGQSTTVTFTVTLPALTLSINPTSFSKNAGANAATGTVSIPAALTGDLTVQLFSNNSNVASVPDSVKITAGQLSTTFTVAAHNDGFPGDSPITIQATATGYSEATADVTATGSSGGGGDTTPPTFSITDPANNSSVTSLAVTKGTATDNVGVAGLSINFYNANTQQYWNGTSWVASYYSFPVTGVGTDGSWTFANGPDASKLIPGTYYVSVNGYDTSFNNSFAQNLVKVVAATQPPTSATLSIAPATFSEAAGANAATATLTLDKPAVSDMTFLLAINVPGALSLPLQNGTPAVTVAAGNNSVTFPIGAVDNSVADGARNVILSASCGSIGANQTVTLTDND
ncbi:MAG: hypothetical protein JOZ57_18505, partial [Abitibacteriaceae bacterium]|nr:hypothetical protein [Abditibacteriaceae bacterium]